MNFIPVGIVAGIWYYSNRDKNQSNKNQSDKNQCNNVKEFFANSQKTPTLKKNYIAAKSDLLLKQADPITGEPKTPIINWFADGVEPEFNDLTDNIKRYNSNAKGVDKFFNQKKIQDDGNQTSRPITFESLTGNIMRTEDIKFNNMVPYFGSTVTQRNQNLNGNEGLLDNYTGRGSQFNQKKEQGPLFKPQKGYDYRSHGMPISTEFIQSRMNTSMRKHDLKPCEAINVGPGLCDSYDSTGCKIYKNTGSNGFNSGMACRSSWIDKNIDELRAKNNQKKTYTLTEHKGPAFSKIQNMGLHGKIEKRQPDTFETSFFVDFPYQALILFFP